MILAECGESGLSGSDTLRAMFRARKEVFVDLLGWDVPVLGGEYEIDAFDDERAEYLIVAGEGGRHLGSARLLRTTGSHILGSLFPSLCASHVPVGPGILEITRFCLDRNQHSLERRLTRNRLISALVTFALRRGIHTYTGVAEVGWLQQILAFGWKCRPLGVPRHLECGTLGALAIEIDPNTPQLLEANGIWTAEPVQGFDLADAA
jgi:N-acyl-L-homoserine lactone synthetase